MRRPLKVRYRRTADSYLRGKKASHFFILFIALTAAVYGVLHESTSGSALEPTVASQAVLSAQSADATPAAESAVEATPRRAPQTSKPAAVATPSSSSESDDDDSEDASDEETEEQTAEAALDEPDAAGTADATTEEQRVRSLGVTPVATPSVSRTPAATGTPRAGSTPGATATPTPTATPRPNACESSDSSAYCVYTVREGDTLSSIANRFGLDSRDLLGWELLAESNKPDINDVNDFLQPGQKLRIPTKYGIVHTVLFDETVGDLADMFDSTSAEIIAANGLSNADLLTVGQVVLIPNPKRIPPPPSTATGEPIPSETPEDESTPEAENTPESAAPEPTEAPPRSRPQSSAGFIWPVTASVNITSYFGPKHPLGIDLGLGHAPRSTIVAAADGKVIFAGGNACCSYGLYVIVEHPNGLQTLYAHLSRIDVRTGQYVSQGDALGPSGSTGYSTGYHLHFEVSKNGVRLNPLNYLP